MDSEKMASQTYVEQRLVQEIGSEAAAREAEIALHKNDVSNPHQVTAEQIGLGNVDNTADTNKPISTAQQTALDLKADKSTTYTKAEVDAIVDALKSGRFIIVEELPDPEEAEEKSIYLVSREESETGNVYDEYVVVSDEWEKIGSTDIDLSGYVPTTRKVNNKALSADVSLDASDVGAATSAQGAKADTAYQKPSDGIPKSDLASGVQTSLGKADTALQSAPVTSVNNKTGAVSLTASDVGAVPTTGGTINGSGLSIDNDGPDATLRLTGIQGDVRLENWGGEYRAIASQQNPNASWHWPGIASPDALARLYDVIRFSEARGYPEGDIVFYNGGLYRCVVALHSGAWNDNSFELVLGGLSTGTPTAPTPTAGDDSTKVATTAFVKTAVDNATSNLDYVMRVNPETGEIYYTTPDANANA